jgi:hypothetical protein
MRHKSLYCQVEWFEAWEWTPKPRVEVWAQVRGKDDKEVIMRTLKYEPDTGVWLHPPDISGPRYTTNDIIRWAYHPPDPWPHVRKMMEPKWRKNGRVSKKNSGKSA